MNNDDPFVIRESCPVCGQGRVFIALGRQAKDMFVMCEDCESEWDSPEQALAGARPTRGEHPFTRFAGADDLEGHPWLGFVVNR